MILDIIIYIVIGTVIYQIGFFILNRVTGGKYINWLNNYRFKKAIQKMERLVKQEEENKEADSRRTEFKSFKDTRMRYETLLERYKHNKDKHKQILVDWTDYVELVDTFVHGYQAIVESGVVIQDFDDRQKENARMNEIEKRFEKLLNQD